MLTSLTSNDHRQNIIIITQHSSMRTPLQQAQVSQFVRK